MSRILRIAAAVLLLAALTGAESCTSTNRPAICDLGPHLPRRWVQPPTRHVASLRRTAEAHNLNRTDDPGQTTG